MTALADSLAGVENVHVAAREDDGEVTFLRTVREGPADRSYGVQVADLAGVPGPVVDRAGEVLDRLREEEAIEARGGTDTTQAVFDLESGQFRGSASADGGEASDPRRASSGATSGGTEEPLDPATESVLEELDGVDLNRLSPLELVSKVQDWQERLED